MDDPVLSVDDSINPWMEEPWMVDFLGKLDLESALDIRRMWSIRRPSMEKLTRESLIVTPEDTEEAERTPFRMSVEVENFVDAAYKEHLKRGNGTSERRDTGVVARESEHQITMKSPNRQQRRSRHLTVTPEYLEGLVCQSDQPGFAKASRKIGMKEGVMYFSTAVIMSVIPAVLADSASAPESTSGTSAQTVLYYIFGGFAVIGVLVGIIMLCFYIYDRRLPRGDNIDSVLDALLRPFRQERSGWSMSVDSLQVGKHSVNGLKYERSV